MSDENCQEVGCPNCENFNCLVQIIEKTHRRAVEWCGEESDKVQTCRLDEEKTGPLRYECLECGYMFVNDPAYDGHDEEDDILVRDYEEDREDKRD